MFKNKILLLILFLASLFEIKAQKIDWSSIKIDSIRKIDKTNNSLINPTEYPDFKLNGIALNVASTEYYDFQKEDFVKNIVKEYIESNNILDNGKRTKRFSIVIKDSGFILNEYQTETRYYYDEGCGVIKNVAIIGKENIIGQDIFCIFENEILPYPKQIKITTIEDSQNRYIEPKRKVTFSDKLDSLTISYKGTYCYESFEYGGLGTIMPLYINVTLSIKDKVTQNEEILLQLPHNNNFNIKSISVADLNSDRHNDIIIETEEELCNFRMIYLTEKNKGLIKYNYIGRMEVHCDCP